MTQRPAPRTLSDDALSELLGKQRFGTLATVRRDGHPHLTTMAYAWDAESRVARFSSTADRIKVAHLRNDPRAALHVPGGDVWSFAVAEGEAEVSGVTEVPGDAVGGSCSAWSRRRRGPPTRPRSSRSRWPSADLSSGCEPTGCTGPRSTSTAERKRTARDPPGARAARKGIRRR